MQAAQFVTGYPFVIIAFTDDDVSVDAGWVEAIGRLFAGEPDVDAVTGLVVPDETDVEAQRLFEEYGGFSRGFDRRYERVDTVSCERAARRHGGAGRFGTGANMAFRRRVFERIGLFDPALDVGTPTNGGGDLEMFFRVLKEGGTTVEARMTHAFRLCLTRPPRAVELKKLVELHAKGTIRNRELFWNVYYTMKFWRLLGKSTHPGAEQYRYDHVWRELDTPLDEPLPGILSLRAVTRALLEVRLGFAVRCCRLDAEYDLHLLLHPSPPGPPPGQPAHRGGREPR